MTNIHKCGGIETHPPVSYPFDRFTRRIGKFMADWCGVIAGITLPLSVVITLFAFEKLKGNGFYYCIALGLIFVFVGIMFLKISWQALRAEQQERRNGRTRRQRINARYNVNNLRH